MSSRVHGGQLLMLPAGLAAGHTLASIALGHEAMSTAGGSWPMQAVVCVSIPLALWAAGAAIRDGYVGESRCADPRALVLQQIAAFVAVDLIEHVATGTNPWTSLQSGRFWVTLGAHAVAGALAWLALRLARRAGRELSPLRTTRCARPAHAPLRAMGIRVVVGVVALSSLSRRGPPGLVPAPPI